jgi:hypothetical protein
VSLSAAALKDPFRETFRQRNQRQQKADDQRFPVFPVFSVGGLEYFSQNQDGEIYNQHYYEFTETRKVKQSRNCDAFGFEVWLGI